GGFKRVKLAQHDRILSGFIDRYSYSGSRTISSVYLEGRPNALCNEKGCATPLWTVSVQARERDWLCDTAMAMRLIKSNVFKELVRALGTCANLNKLSSVDAFYPVHYEPVWSDPIDLGRLTEADLEKGDDSSEEPEGGGNYSNWRQEWNDNWNAKSNAEDKKETEEDDSECEKEWYERDQGRSESSFQVKEQILELKEMMRQQQVEIERLARNVSELTIRVMNPLPNQ
ncbi:hypothetical protein FOL47_004872, partial [Perkinsus chesapeaki]